MNKIRILYTRSESFDSFRVRELKSGSIFNVGAGDDPMPAALASSLVRRGMAEWVEGV